MRGVAARDGHAPRRRTLLPTLILILLGILIVCDIVVRRWSSGPPPGPDVTRLR